MLHHGEIEEDVNHRIKARWMKGRITSKVLCFFMLTSRALMILEYLLSSRERFTRILHVQFCYMVLNVGLSYQEVICS